MLTIIIILAPTAIPIMALTSDQVSDIDSYMLDLTSDEISKDCCSAPKKLTLTMTTTAILINRILS